MPVFKVWSWDRMTRKCIPIETFNLNSLKLVINEKFDATVNDICLESDGTIIEDNICLEEFQKEVFMFLEKDQFWESPTAHMNSPTISVSSLSTVSTFSDSNMSDKESELEFFDLDQILNNLPPSFQKQFSEGKKLNFADMGLFVRIIVDNMRLAFGNYAGRKHFKIICEHVLAKYKKTFTDTDDDNVIIGIGYTSLLRKLEDRNNYLNRSHKIDPNNLNKQIIRKRHSKNMQVGCVQWQPGEIPEGQNLDSCNEKKSKLMEWHALGVENENVETFMQETYPVQRLFINAQKIPTIQEIKKEWPYLLESKYLLQHFETLTGCNIRERLVNSQIKLRKVIFYLTNVEDKNSSLDELMISFLKAVTQHFKEDLSKAIIQFQDDGTTKNDATKEINILTPCILQINDTVNYLSVEKVLINDGYTKDNFTTSFSDMFSLYFILNLKYPKDLSLTFEFIQRYLLKINQESGTKTAKKSCMRTNSILNRVLSLLKKLSDFKYEFIAEASTSNVL